MEITNPKLYLRYVAVENGKIVLYARFKNPLYELLRSVIIFYRNLLADL